MRGADDVSDPAPKVKATRRLIFGGGSHEERLALLRGGRRARCVDFRAYPARASIKHTRSSELLRALSQPTAYQDVQQDDHHHDSEHHEGRKQDERHRASNTPLFVLADTAWGFFGTRAQHASNAGVPSVASACELLLRRR
jgi:hypothetical protein